MFLENFQKSCAGAFFLYSVYKQNAEEEKPAPSIDGPLFSSDETTVDADSVVLEDGNWTFRKTNTRSDNDNVTYEQFEFTQKGGSLDASSFKYTISTKGTIPSTVTITDQMKEDAKELGYNLDGNNYTWYKEFTTDDYLKLSAELQERYPDGPTYQEMQTDMKWMVLYQISVTLLQAQSPNSITKSDGTTKTSFKTNSDKTKYFGVNKYDHETESFYFAKN